MARGLTLPELLVVLAILGLIFGVSVASLHGYSPKLVEPMSAVADARSTALRTGNAVRTRVHAGDRVYDVLAYPDGSVVADTAVHVERLTGVAHAER
jgi:prepilin-type N-terminal cleavage/methylation domain-containing protein